MRWYVTVCTVIGGEKHPPNARAMSGAARVASAIVTATANEASWVLMATPSCTRDASNAHARIPLEFLGPRATRARDRSYDPAGVAAPGPECVRPRAAFERRH